MTGKEMVGGDENISKKRRREIRQREIRERYQMKIKEGMDSDTAEELLVVEMIGEALQIAEMCLESGISFDEVKALIADYEQRSAEDGSESVVA